MTIKTRGIVEAGSEFRLPAGFFQGLTLASVAGPAFEFTEAGAAVAAGHTFGAGVVVIRRADDGSSDDSVFTLTEPGDGSGGTDGRGIASMTISGGRLTGTYTDGAAWDAGTLPRGDAGPAGPQALSETPNTGHSISGPQTTVQATGIYAGLSAGSQAITINGLTLPAAVTAEQISEVYTQLGGERLTYGQVVGATLDGAVTIVLITPVAIVPGAELVIVFTAALPMRRAPGLLGTPSNGFRTGYLDEQGGLVSAPLAMNLGGMYRQVFAPLAADAMNVVRAPSSLGRGDFEIVAAPSSAPRLRFRDYDGQVYTVPMTPEQ